MLDFGLAIPLPRELQQGAHAIAGTLVYLAPEILQGQPPSEASDLYALGMIAFEVLAGGRHPLEAIERQGVQALVEAILSLSVDTSELDVPVALRELVAQLLSPDPARRPVSAAHAVHALYRAIGQPAPAEAVPIRESYLQAAQFVGREEELEGLTAHLRRALNGHGTVLLIGGESGVGKSRLLDEVRTQALVRGTRVLRGQAMREGGGGFHVLHDIIEPLCLEVTPPAPALSVLQRLFPRLALLLQRAPVADSVLEGRSLQEQALQTLDQLFELAAARLGQPLVVLLEDLHWAGRETLLLLARLATWATSRPLLVIGTYRDDELPELPRLVPDAEILKLRRLDASRIAALSRSMLGAIGQSPELIEFLRRESEGNPLFIVEILRALAEEAGTLDRVTAQGLPEGVLTGGVRAILERRIRHLPEWARPLLELAAVAGRVVDEKVLERTLTAGALAGPSFATWITLCAEHSIFEIHDQRWRFAHDKIRECLLAQLPTGEPLRQRHHELALALLAAYPDSAHDEHLLALASHLVAAVPLVPAERALAVALPAARQAMKQLAFAEAAGLLERLLQAVEDAALDAGVRYELLLIAGEASIRAGAIERGKAACARAAELARSLGDAERLATAAITHGIEFTMGQHDRVLIQLLEEAQRTLPPGDRPLKARVLARLASALQPAPDPQGPIDMAYQAIAMARRLHDPELLRAVLFAAGGALAAFAHPRETLALNQELKGLALLAQDRIQIHRATARLIFDCMALGDTQSADENIRDFGCIAGEFRQPQYQWPIYMLRALRLLNQGLFAEAERQVERARALTERVRDFSFLPAWMLQRWYLLRAAERPDDLLRFEPEFRALALRIIPDRPGIPLIISASTHARVGDLPTARALLRRLHDSRELWPEPMWCFFLGEPCFRVGDPVVARRAYELLLPRAECFFQSGFAGVCTGPPNNQALGLLALTLGQPATAVAHLQSALAASEASGLRGELPRLRYECALALRRRGHTGDAGSARALLVSARELACELAQGGLIPDLDAELAELAERTERTERTERAELAAGAAGSLR